MARNATFRGANLQYVAAPKSLAGLSDVTVASAANLDRLQYSTSAGKWVDVVALTTPQIEDASADHQYVFAVSELAADRTITLPLLTGNDTFVFASFAATLANKTLTSAVLNTGVSGSAVLDQDDMSGNSATQLATQQSIKAYVDAQVATEDTLAELNDTTISGPASLDVLQYSGSAWVDRTYAEAGIVSLTGSETLTNKTLASPVITTGDINTPDIDGGTVDAITSLTVANNVDVGSYTVRASGFLADGLTSGQVVYTGTDGVLSSEAALAYNAGTNTLTATNIAGTLSTAAQANITSVGTLTDLTVSGTSTTIGTVTSGVWNAGAVTSSGLITGTDLSISGTSTTIGTVTSGTWNAGTVAASASGINSFERTTSATTTSSSPLRVWHTTSGNMADGFGADILFRIGDPGAADSSIGKIGFVRAGADNTGDFIVVPYAAGGSNERMRITSAGDMTVTGDVTAARLVINQGADDDDILSLKSSDVAHGITGRAETDTFGFIKKAASTDGGILMEGLTESTRAIRFVGTMTAGNTTKSTAAEGVFEMEPYLKDGTGGADLVTDTNVLVIKARSSGNSLARFIFDAEGSGHADVEWTTYSDDRLKSNQQPLPYGMAEISQLEPKIYDRDHGSIAGGVVALEHNSYRHIGFIAQEVREVIPEIVRDVDENTSFYSLDDGKLVAVVVKALQEIDDRVKALEGA